MPSYKDYIAQAQKYMRDAQAKDPAFQAWNADAQRYTADMGPAPAWNGTDYFKQWLGTLSPESQADYLKQMNDSSTWQNKVGGVLKVAIPAAVGGAGLAATGLLGSGLQAAVGGAPLGSAGAVGAAGAAAPALTGADAAMADLAASGGLTGSSMASAPAALGGWDAAMTDLAASGGLTPSSMGAAAGGSGLLGSIGSGLSSATKFLGDNRALVSLLGGALAAAGSGNNSGNTATKTYAPQPGMSFGTMRQTSQPGTASTFTAQNNARGLLNSGLSRYGATGGLFQPGIYQPNVYTWGK